jgi:hypothetical protein
MRDGFTGLFVRRFVLGDPLDLGEFGAAPPLFSENVPRHAHLSAIAVSPVTISARFSPQTAVASSIMFSFLGDDLISAPQKGTAASVP